MPRILTALIFALIAGWVVAGSSTSASAYYRHHGCCGPISPTYHYHTVHPVIHRTRVHDVNVAHHVHKIHRVVDVTRVQPIIRVTDLTRVHHHTIVHVRDAYEHEVVHLPPIQYVNHITTSTYDCNCVRPRHHCW